MKKLVLLFAFLALPLGAQADEPEAAKVQSARISTERNVSEAAFRGAVKACYAKFAVIDCLNEARAKRRHRELQDYGVTVDYQSVYDDLVERDARDATRAVAPMKPAKDAIVIDTSNLTMNEVFEKALELIG